MSKTWVRAEHKSGSVVIGYVDEVKSNGAGRHVVIDENSYAWANFREWTVESIVGPIEEDSVFGKALTAYFQDWGDSPALDEPLSDYQMGYFDMLAIIGVAEGYLEAEKVSQNRQKIKQILRVWDHRASHQ